MDHRDLLSGFIRLHILHHAAEGELYGQWMIEELARHGYRLSPGTLYPLLHGLEKKGYLVSRMEREGRTARKYYRATPLGRKVIKLATVKAKELFGEIVPDQRQRTRTGRR
jgi:DNA-binding PadR family transcriptional regulator